VSDCCAYCDRPFDSESRRTKDHVVPRAGGGKGIPNNTIDACGSCNLAKAHFGPKGLRKRARKLEAEAALLRQIADRTEQIIKERKLL
jgi:5-methylcytosine-specific restriction endonuclease McrA